MITDAELLEVVGDSVELALNGVLVAESIDPDVVVLLTEPGVVVLKNGGITVGSTVMTVGMMLPETVTKLVTTSGVNKVISMLGLALLEDEDALLELAPGLDGGELDEAAAEVSFGGAEDELVGGAVTPVRNGAVVTNVVPLAVTVTKIGPGGVIPDVD